MRYFVRTKATTYRDYEIEALDEEMARAIFDEGTASIYMTDVEEYDEEIIRISEEEE